MKLPIFMFLLLSLVNVSASIAQETGFTYSERELQYLMSIWPGNYDNQEQISLDARASTDEEVGQGRFHAVVVPLDVPSIGENLLYIEKSIGGDLNNVYQQRLYKLVADEGQKAIRIKAYVLKRPQKYQGAARHENVLSNLRPKDLVELAGCDLLLRRADEGFAGSNTWSTCEDGEKPGYLERHIRVSQDKYSFNDRRYLKNGSQIVNTTLTPRIMRRARWFACMVDVPKETLGRSNFTQHYITIHDQGGAFTFTHPDGREMTLVMRNTWSYGMQRETFFIGVFEGDANGKLLVYSWGAPGSDRIGMNPGYVRIQCDLNNPRNVRLQKGLRAES